MTEIVTVDPERPEIEIIERAAAIIRSGGLVAFPTETVYGLGADATNSEAVCKIFAAKGRPPTNPLIVHCENVDRVRDECVASWPESAQKLADAFWPGPLTLILPKSGAIPAEVTAGLACVGVRIPASAVARALIAAADRPIAAPSANRSNRISPTRAAHVAKDLGEEVALILDAGPCSAGVESTVLDLSGPATRILRPGPIDATSIEAVLGEPVETVGNVATDSTPQASPGQSRLHYAPRKPLLVVPVEKLLLGESTATLVLGILPDQNREEHSPLFMSDLGNYLHIPAAKAAEKALYAFLHKSDEDPRVIEIHVAFGGGTDSPEWAALRDRIKRASSHSH
jgi:L-threonylcarbamoyladenylate synthase